MYLTNNIARDIIKRNDFRRIWGGCRYILYCITIPNAMIVTAALLYGKGDYAKSICMAVETAFDTDCNGATVGSILGMANGLAAIPAYWQGPINDTLMTTITWVGTVKVSDRVKMTLAHINKKIDLDKPLRMW